MKRIRRFWLRNSSGESYGLNGEKKIYSTGWAGLGVALSPSYADLNYGFFVSVNEDDEPQNNITCTLVFTGGSPYADYTQFVNWLAASGTVSLAYDPTGAQTYYRDIKINYLQKGELNSVGWLEAPENVDEIVETEWEGLFRPLQIVRNDITNGYELPCKYVIHAGEEAQHHTNWRDAGLLVQFHSSVRRKSRMFRCLIPFRLMSNSSRETTYFGKLSRILSYAPNSRLTVSSDASR